MHRLNRDPARFSPLADYLGQQGRFKHLDAGMVSRLERQRDERWKTLRQWEEFGKQAKPGQLPIAEEVVP
jgi:pyruvate/2-oxoacid:ferredoxin oxidoreductase beta subunit